MGDLTRNFSRAEFACPCCDRADMDLGFVAKLQELRFFIDQPIRVTSGFRCPMHNEVVGGAENSKHLAGIAADITIQGGRWRLLKGIYRLDFRGIGIYDTWIHVDSREGPGALWVG